MRYVAHTLVLIGTCSALIASGISASAQSASPTPTATAHTPVTIVGVAQSARLLAAPPLPTTRSWLSLYGLPAHWRVLFDGEPFQADITLSKRQIFIVPLEDYRRVFHKSDVAKFARVLAELEALVSTPSPSLAPTAEWTPLPLPEQSNVMQARLNSLRFANGRGVRMIAHFTQEIQPVTAEQLTYVFQGLTDDRRFFVAAYFPVQTSALPLSPEDMSNDERDWLRRDYQVYLEQVAARLESPTTVFTPSLRALDAMMASLRVNQAELSAAEAPTLHIVRTTDFLNLRAEPSMRAAVLAILPPSFELTLSGRTNDERWAFVKLRDGRSGWVSTLYLAPRNAIRRLPVTR